MSEAGAAVHTMSCGGKVGLNTDGHAVAELQSSCQRPSQSGHSGKCSLYIVLLSLKGKVAILSIALIGTCGKWQGRLTFKPCRVRRDTKPQLPLVLALQ